MKRLHLYATLILPLLMTSCTTTTKSDMLPLEIQVIQSKTFNTTKEIAFASTVSIFQDLGFMIKSADIHSGYISAESEVSDSLDWDLLFGIYRAMRQTRATALIEEQRDQVTIRLNFTDARENSFLNNRQKSDKRILNAEMYRNAFEQIEHAIFMRSSS